NILLMVHQLLFGQRIGIREEPWPNPDVGVVDTLLVAGPLLSKFTGRICYTHFTREKTIAILSPLSSMDELPARFGIWEDSPFPPYSEDVAVRRWHVRPTSAGTKESCCEF